MPATRVKTIRAPLRGVHKRADFQSQPEYTVYGSRDFWGKDCRSNSNTLGRSALAVRPGFATYASGYPETQSANLIASLNVAKGTEYLFAAAAGSLYKFTADVPAAVGSGVTTGRNVQWTVYLQDLFIANDGTPKVYKNTPNTFGNWTASVGSVPSNCRLTCTWGDRVVLAGAPSAPHVWRMSREGNPYDWLFAEEDDGSPISNAEVNDGRLSDPITALIPHNRQCIIFGTPNSLSVLRGNPAAGGQHEWIAHVVGPICATAWCKTPSDWTYILTRDGLYRMAPGCGSNPEPVSSKVIPESLRAIDGLTSLVHLCYDVLFHGIHIYVTNATTGNVTDAWWFDLEFEGFWPITSPGNALFATHRHDPIETADQSGVLIATSSGLRRLDRTQPLGGSRFAFAYIGPFGLEQALGRKSLIQRACVNFTSSTDDRDATVQFYGAENGETVVGFPQERSESYTIGELLDNHGNCYPRIGGQAGMIAISQSDTSKHIAFTEAALTLPRAGEERG